MKSPVIIMVCLTMALCSFSVNAATITSTATGGRWATGATWVGGSVPATNDVVVIATSGGNTVSIESNLSRTGSVTVNSGAILIANTSNVTVVFGALTILDGGTHTMNRDFTVSGLTNITGTINFGSTSSTSRVMTFTGAVTLNDGAI